MDNFDVLMDILNSSTFISRYFLIKCIREPPSEGMTLSLSPASKDKGKVVLQIEDVLTI